MSQYVDYGFGQFEYQEDPYSKQYINGGGPATNVAGPARTKARRKQGWGRRHLPDPNAPVGMVAFHKAMREVFVGVMRDQLMHDSILFYKDGTGRIPPKDPRTAWERALDENFYDPEERERRRREWEEDRCTCDCGCCW